MPAITSGLGVRDLQRSGEVLTGDSFSEMMGCEVRGLLQLPDKPQT